MNLRWKLLTHRSPLSEILAMPIVLLVGLLLLPGFASAQGALDPSFLREVGALAEKRLKELERQQKQVQKEFRANSKHYVKASKYGRIQGLSPLFQGEMAALRSYQSTVSRQRHLIRVLVQAAGGDWEGWAGSAYRSLHPRQTPAQAVYSISSVARRLEHEMEALRREEEKAEATWEEGRKQGLDLRARDQRARQDAAFERARKAIEAEWKLMDWLFQGLGKPSLRSALDEQTRQEERSLTLEREARRRRSQRLEAAKEDWAALLVSAGVAAVVLRILDTEDLSPGEKQQELRRLKAPSKEVNEALKNSCIARGGDFVGGTEESVGFCRLPGDADPQDP